MFFLLCVYIYNLTFSIYKLSPTQFSNILQPRLPLVMCSVDVPTEQPGTTAIVGFPISPSRDSTGVMENHKNGS